MSERATLQETLEFANKVREAGGGNPLSALMPSVPEEPHECLIAKNLNFNCRVDGTGGGNGGWYMGIDDEDTAQRIADALDLEYLGEVGGFNGEFRIVLPENIGAVAADFDRAGNMWGKLYCAWEDYNNYKDNQDEYPTYVVPDTFKEFLEAEYSGLLTEDDDMHGSLENFEDMLPYIAESFGETEEIGFIKNGKLVL